MTEVFDKMLTPLEAAFICAVMASPETWETAHSLPTMRQDSSTLASYGQRVLGAAKRSTNEIIMPDNADFRSPFWLSILAHEADHLNGGDEERARKVQSACEKRFY